MLLKREGWKVGKKLVYNLYREEDLTRLAFRAGRHVAGAHRYIL